MYKTASSFIRTVTHSTGNFSPDEVALFVAAHRYYITSALMAMQIFFNTTKTLSGHQARSPWQQHWNVEIQDVCFYSPANTKPKDSSVCLCTIRKT